MKILIILNDLDVGGAQNYTISLMNEFVKMGNEVDLKVLSKNLLLSERVNDRIKIETWERKNKFDFGVIRKLKAELKSHKYDLIISSYVLYTQLANILLTNSPLILFPIHTTISRSKKDSIFMKIGFKLKKNNEIFISSINNQTEYLTKYYNLPVDFFEEINNGIDNDKFSLPPSSFDKNSFLTSMGIEVNYHLVLMVAGFRLEKRHYDAIDAFEELLKLNSNVSIAFVGDNRVDYAKQLEEYTIQKGIQNVHFFTSSMIDDIRHFYWSSDLFLLTSNSVETFPISVLEAMSTGLPCVLTSIGGAKNIIIPNENGALVIPEDINSIKEGLYSVISDYHNYKAEDIRNIIISNYSISKAAKEYINLYHKYAN